MTYADSVRFLYSLGNEIQTAKFGLERISRLLDGLGNPERRGRFIHVAGTNGKGSTCAMMEAGLRAAGIRTGLYTSPHLEEPIERIQIAGRPIGEDHFAEAFTEVHRVAGEMLASHQIDLHPTYFETVTAMAFLLFAREKADTIVLEVGLGGRLDATNVVSPALSVITPIDFDHQAFLGDTLAKIAAEKGGILKPGVPAIFSEQRDAAETVLRAHAKGPYTLTREWPIRNLELNVDGSRFSMRDLDILCPLAGRHQVENARTAAIALHQLGISPAGIANTRWPGRLEHIANSPEIILDGAHNPAGTRALVEYIRTFYGGRRIWVIYGVMKDKAVAEMSEILFPLAHRVILTSPANSRALPPESIPANDAIISHTVSEALAMLRDVDPSDVVFITGSLFVVGEARALLVK